MITLAGITVVHNPARFTTMLTDRNNDQVFELDHGGLAINPGKIERTMLRAYRLGGTVGLLGCFGAEHIRLCP
ncbi:hypothetical protein [Telmatospirillum sp.]|uniref:hypothetical protein n=1 Tax=Telmatospirillum sp. TaxID=2079197 RepID=UPI00283FD5C6|nr:hypothetical protein [Telmatospirillum sp.]MDR3441221.1 hypothetical protein [Telmatospirillum sp.]